MNLIEEIKIFFVSILAWLLSIIDKCPDFTDPGINKSKTYTFTNTLISNDPENHKEEIIKQLNKLDTISITKNGTKVPFSIENIVIDPLIGPPGGPQIANPYPISDKKRVEFSFECDNCCLFE